MLVVLVVLKSLSDATLPTIAPEDNKKILEMFDPLNLKVLSTINETLLTAESNKENVSNETGRKQ